MITKIMLVLYIVTISFSSSETLYSKSFWKEEITWGRDKVVDVVEFCVTVKEGEVFDLPDVIEEVRKEVKVVGVVVDIIEEMDDGKKLGELVLYEISDETGGRIWRIFNFRDLLG